MTLFFAASSLWRAAIWAALLCSLAASVLRETAKARTLGLVAVRWRCSNLWRGMLAAELQSSFDLYSDSAQGSGRKGERWHQTSNDVDCHPAIQTNQQKMVTTSPYNYRQWSYEHSISRAGLEKKESGDNLLQGMVCCQINRFMLKRWFFRWDWGSVSRGGNPIQCTISEVGFL